MAMRQRMKVMAVLWLGLAMMACVADADAVSPRQLVEIADISGPVISPDGRMVAYRVEQASVERNTYETAWYVAGMDGLAPPRRLADGGIPLRDSSGVPLAAQAVWSPDGRWIYYRALIGGRIDVWRAAVDGAVVGPITRDQADVRAFRLSDDGLTLFYSVGATRKEVRDAELAEYDAGIHIDKSIPIGQGLFRSGFLEERLATQRLKDNGVIRHPLLADVADRWISIDLATGAKKPVAKGASAVDEQQALLTRDGGFWKTARELGGTRVAVLTRVGEKRGLRAPPDVELSVIDRRRGRGRVTCALPLCTGVSITSIQWRPDSSDVIFTVSSPDRGYAQSIFRWDVDANIVHRVVDGQGLVNGGRNRFSSCGLSSTALACVTADPNRPPRLERIDLASGERRVLHDPNESLAWDMASVPVRLLRWTDDKGTTYTGQLFTPVGWNHGPTPLVISYYWCLGFVRGGLGDEMPFASLAEKGIAALCINRAPVRVDAVKRYELGRSAVESAVEHLVSQGLVKRDKVGMGGLSFGTEVTIWTAMYSNVLAAASVSSPMLSPQLRLLLGLQSDAFEQRLDAYWQLGDKDETDARWRTMSPVFNLDRLRIPFLMQMPEQEYMYVLDYAIPLIRSGLADMYVFPNEPHQKFQPRHKLAVYERNLDWFRFWLRGEEDPNPGKSTQYARWRGMKNGLLQASGTAKPQKRRHK